jgi:PPOX class probable F420-dependent enzyme
MASEIPSSVLDLLGERPLICALCTTNPDEQPHAVPVWFDFDGANIRVNSPDTARKARNMSMGSKVTVLVIDPNNAYHWVEIMGHVVDIKEDAEGGREHINKLAMKYRGEVVYQAWHGRDENRVMYVIEPDKVHGQ